MKNIFLTIAIVIMGISCKAQDTIPLENYQTYFKEKGTIMNLE